MTVGLKRLEEYRELFEQCHDRDSEIQMLAYNGARNELSLAHNWVKLNRPQFTKYLEPMGKLLDDFGPLPQVFYDNAQLRSNRRYDRLEMLAAKYTDTTTLQGLYAVIGIRSALDIEERDYRAGDSFRSAKNGGVEIQLSEEAQALRDKLNRIRNSYPNPRAITREVDNSPSP